MTDIFDEVTAHLESDAGPGTDEALDALDDLQDLILRCNRGDVMDVSDSDLVTACLEDLYSYDKELSLRIGRATQALIENPYVTRKLEDVLLAIEES